MNRPLTLLVKPVGAECDFRCDYCFYLPKRALHPDGAGVMDFATLEAMTRRYLEHPTPLRGFAWQGGEPTLAGIDFYREAVRLQKKYAAPGTRIVNAFQTHGARIDDAWAAFFREHGFLVGVSLDGPEAVHNRHRRRDGGQGGHADALRGLRALRRAGVDHNVLTLVTDANHDRPADLYRYLKALGVRHHQYIECADRDDGGARRAHALAPGQWGRFLRGLFDAWYPDDTGTVSVRLFDSVVSRLVSGIPTMCSMGSRCDAYFVVERDGGVYPCDFHVEPDLLLGNVRDRDFASLRADARYAEWAGGKTPRAERCADCRYAPLCLGDCPRHRVDGLSVLCDDWRAFYDHTIERFEYLAAGVSAKTGLDNGIRVARSAPAAAPAPASRESGPRGVARRARPNDPCPCGSGRKFKKCHGRADP